MKVVGYVMKKIMFDISNVIYGNYTIYGHVKHHTTATGSYEPSTYLFISKP